jgi:hypothetical protein
MQSWHTTYLGLRELPREISTFELQSFFTYSRAERELIHARRGNAHKLGLALHIGFLRLSGRMLNSVRIVPATLWQHLGNEIGITAPELAPLRALYVRGRTLFDHHQLACDVLGFKLMTEHQRRALVLTLRDEVAQCADQDQLFVFARRWLYQSKILILRDRDIRVLVTAALGQLEEETAETIATVAPGVRIVAAEGDQRPSGKRRYARPSNKLREDVMATLNSEAFKDLPPSRVVPRLADTGVYMASESTMYRLLRQQGQLAHRRAERAAQKRNRPRALAATGPDQVFCWDTQSKINSSAASGLTRAGIGVLPLC